MTTATVFTRLYADPQQAQKVIDKLRRKGLPAYQTRLVAARDGEKAKDIGARLSDLCADDTVLDAYAKKIKSGAACVVVHATYKPLGAAQLTREILADTDAMDMGDVVEEAKARLPQDPSPSILKEHPRLLTYLPEIRNRSRGGTISKGLGIPLLTEHKKRDSAIPGGKHISPAFWPMPLIKRGRKADSVIKGGKHLSQAFWPMPLVTRSRRRLSVIRGGGTPLSTLLGWPTTS